MISHRAIIISLLLGVPQGAYLGVSLSRLLGFAGIGELILLAGGSFAGIMIGYAEILFFRKLLGGK